MVAIAFEKHRVEACPEDRFVGLHVFPGIFIRLEPFQSGEFSACLILDLRDHLLCLDSHNRILAHCHGIASWTAGGHDRNKEHANRDFHCNQKAARERGMLE